MSDPLRPDLPGDAYREMEPRWNLVDDIREGTLTIRAKKETYLPKFEAETPLDWEARVKMTFANDHYETTLTEHVGLVLSAPIALGKDVPAALVPLIEDIDGAGNHLDVFAQTVLDSALHLGHAVLYTDYPDATDVQWKAEEIAAQMRPYVTLYPARDVLDWKHVTVGGIKALVWLKLRESSGESEGDADAVTYREITQMVFYDAVTARATGLGAITWRTYRVGEDGTIVPVGAGIVKGPQRIPARVVYGGQKLGLLRTKPHLYGLSLTSEEETQVKSDYAKVMHSCNVPTPVFIGRNVNDASAKVQMGQGIDIPVGGSAMMLEPSGVALSATRARLLDIQAQMRRQGASMDDATSTSTKTATEAKLYAAQRNAKLARAARSLQDALEGVLADMAAFLGLPSGGSLTVAASFKETGIDPAYLTVLVEAYKEGALNIQELRYVISTGKLPEDFDATEVVELLADKAARDDAAADEAAVKAAEKAMGDPMAGVDEKAA